MFTTTYSRQRLGLVPQMSILYIKDGLSTDLLIPLMSRRQELQSLAEYSPSIACQQDGLTLCRVSCEFTYVSVCARLFSPIRVITKVKSQKRAEESIQT